MEYQVSVRRFLLTALLPLCGCGYTYYAGQTKPLDEQAASMQVGDDGSVTFAQGRLEVRARAVPQEELNRRFESMSHKGPKSTNPYTFGDSERPKDEIGSGRFTVFYLSVKNYEYPKVLIDPAAIALFADNGRQYWTLSLLQLSNYFRAYAQGYAGNEYIRYRARTDLLNQTLFKKQMVFSGQEADGYLVFRDLHPDVAQLTMVIHGAVTRFDYRDEPVETTDIAYRFGRDIGKLHPDGTISRFNRHSPPPSVSSSSARPQ